MSWWPGRINAETGTSQWEHGNGEDSEYPRSRTSRGQRVLTRVRQGQQNPDVTSVSRYRYGGPVFQLLQTPVSQRDCEMPRAPPSVSRASGEAPWASWQHPHASTSSLLCRRAPKPGSSPRIPHQQEPRSRWGAGNRKRGLRVLIMQPENPECKPYIHHLQPRLLNAWVLLSFLQVSVLLSVKWDKW